MFLHVTCSGCGETGWVLVEDLGDLPRCLRCGHELAIASPSGDGSAGPGGANDEEVVSWLSQPAGSPAPLSAGAATCLSCGYEGLMQYDSARGDTICPACLAVYRTRTASNYRMVECPGCGMSFEISDRDRGKTVICPGCKYFLGCLIPAEKHTYRKRRARR